MYFQVGVPPLPERHTAGRLRRRLPELPADQPRPLQRRRRALPALRARFAAEPDPHHVRALQHGENGSPPQKRLRLLPSPPPARVFCVVSLRVAAPARRLQRGPAAFSPDGAACSTCAPGKAVHSARTGCGACPANMHSADGAICSLCLAGQGPGLGQTSCQPCGRGEYSSDVTGRQCHPCAPGEQPNAAADGCEVCGPGSVSSDGRGCVACRPGTAPTVGNTSCAGCTSPTQFSAVGRGCIDCADGWVANAARTDCAPCTMSGE